MRGRLLWALCLAFVCAEPLHAGPLDDAKAEFQAGMAAQRSGDLTQAREHLLRARELSSTVPEAKWQQAACTEALGMVEGRLGKQEDKLALCEHALGLYRQLEGTQWEQANCLAAAAVAKGQLGLDAAAGDSAREALAVYRKTEGTKWEQANCLATIGASAHRLGRFQVALEALREALSLYEATEGAELEWAACALELGAVHGNLGDVQLKADLTNQALGLYENLPGTEYKQAGCWQNLGAAHAALGEHERGVQCATRALSLYGDSAEKAAGRARCMINQAVSLGALGQGAAQVALLEQSLKLLQDSSAHPYDVGECLTDLGLARLELGKTKPGLDDLRKAEAAFLEIAPTPGVLPRGLYKAEMGVGRGLVALGSDADLYAGFEHYARAAQLVEHSRLVASTAFEHRVGYFTRSAWVYDEIIDLLCEMRQRGLPIIPERLSESAPDFWRQLGLDTPALWQDWETYEDAIWYFSEQARTRALRETLLGLAGSARSGREPGDHPEQESWAHVAQLRAREQQLSANIEFAAREQDVRRVAGLRAELASTSILRSEAEAALPQTHVGQVVDAPPATLADAKSLLVDRSALVAYKLLPRRLMIFIVLADTTDILLVPVHTGADEPLFGSGSGEVIQGQVERMLGLLSQDASRAENAPPGVRLPATAEQLRQRFSIAELVWLFRRSMGMMGRGEEQSHLAALASREQLLEVSVALYDLLLRPVAGKLRQLDVEIERLLIVPDGALFYLPFGALASIDAGAQSSAPAGQCFAADGVRFAVEGWQLGYLTSVSAQKAALQAASGRPEPTRSLLVMADPAFPESHPRASAAGREASAGWGLRRLPHTREEAAVALGAFSAVSPAPLDGALTMEEVLGLNLNARTVTLSACRTAEGQLARGEGMLGLVTAFTVSGARAVTASLWPVADEATARLVGAYQRELASGKEPAAAMQSAQRELLQAGRAAFAGAPSSSQAHWAHP